MGADKEIIKEIIDLVKSIRVSQDGFVYMKRPAMSYKLFFETINTYPDIFSLYGLSIEYYHPGDSRHRIKYLNNQIIYE